MTFLHGFLIATLVTVSMFAYASFNGYLMKSHFDVKSSEIASGNEVPLYDARGNKVQ